ncbi:MAG: rhomboid family intramembrane serine protease [Alphaproteobacteria bacterium]
MADSFPEEDGARHEPIFKVPGIIVALLTVMIAVQAVIAWGNPRTAVWIIETFGFTPSAYAQGAPATIGGWAKLLWPFVTHALVHGNWLHLGVNSVWLLAVATPLARRLGTPAFLVFYFVSGVGAVGLHWALNAGSPATVVGASGAISGCMAGAVRILLGGSARYFARKHPGFGSLAPLWDRRLIIVSGVFVIVNVATGFGLTPMLGTEGAQIAWGAHVGGYIAGLFLMPLFDRLAGDGRSAYPTLSVEDRP